MRIRPDPTHFYMIQTAGRCKPLVVLSCSHFKNPKSSPKNFRAHSLLSPSSNFSAMARFLTRALPLASRSSSTLHSPISSSSPSSRLLSSPISPSSPYPISPHASFSSSPFDGIFASLRGFQSRTRPGSEKESSSEKRPEILLKFLCAHGLRKDPELMVVSLILLILSFPIGNLLGSDWFWWTFYFLEVRGRFGPFFWLVRLFRFEFMECSLKIHACKWVIWLK